MGEAFARGIDYPAPFLRLGAVRHDLADGGRHQRDDLAVELAHHGEHVLDVLDRALALALILGGEVAFAEHERHRTPAADAVLLEQRTRLVGLVLFGLARDLDRFIAEFLDALQRHLQRLRAHPIVRRKMHGLSFPEFACHIYPAPPPIEAPARFLPKALPAFPRNWFDQLGLS